MASNDGALVRVANLKKHFPIRRGVFQRTVGWVKAVDGVSFEIKRGETLGLVGESGCGKTTVGRTILRLYPPTGGHILFDSVDLTSLKGESLRRLRPRMQMIFQDPYASLDPRSTVGELIAEPLLIHGLADQQGRRERVKQLMELVGLNPAYLTRYPHEFSGGQRQRIGIARALSLNPEFIVCDEPIAALDVSVQAQVVNLLEELQEKLELTYLFVAHDLSMVRHIAGRVLVMYLGKMMEMAVRDELYDNPLHPYTIALLSAVPVPDPVAEEARRRIILQGDVPSPANPPKGCVFHTRCPLAIDVCRQAEPEWREFTPGHFVACHRAEEIARKEVVVH